MYFLPLWHRFPIEYILKIEFVINSFEAQNDIETGARVSRRLALISNDKKAINK